jgi:hypothetical protein
MPVVLQPGTELVMNKQMFFHADPKSETKPGKMLEECLCSLQQLDQNLIVSKLRRGANPLAIRDRLSRTYCLFNRCGLRRFVELFGGARQCAPESELAELKVHGVMFVEILLEIGANVVDEDVLL